MVQYLHFRILEFPLNRGFVGMQRYAPYLTCGHWNVKRNIKPYLKHWKMGCFTFEDWHFWKRNHVDWGINQKGSVLVGCARQTVKGSIQCHLMINTITCISPETKHHFHFAVRSSSASEPFRSSTVCVLKQNISTPTLGRVWKMMYTPDTNK